MRSLLLVCAGLLALFSGSFAAPGCALYFTEYMGSCYRVASGTVMIQGTTTVMEGMPFMMANTWCQQQHPDAHLVVINSKEEHDFIFNWVPAVEPLEMWIGLFFNATTFQWEWVNGDPVNYTAWEPFYGEPLIRNGGAGVMFLSEVFTPQFTLNFGYGFETSNFWTTEMVDELLPFMCEYTYNTNMTHQENTTTSVNSTAEPATGVPVTQQPPMLYQENNQPLRLSDFFGFGGLGLHEVKKDRRARPAYVPQQYKRNNVDNYNNNNQYQYMAMP